MMSSLLKLLSDLDDSVMAEVMTLAERRELQEKIKTVLRKRVDEVLFERYQQDGSKKQKASG